MPDPNPLNALRKATSISSGSPKPSQITASQMPIPPWGGSALIDAVKSAPGAIQGLAKYFPAASEASTYTGPIQETLGETDPMFTPVGGEGLYNIAKTGIKSIEDPIESAYRAILNRGGR